MAEKNMDIHELLDRAQLSADQSPKTHILYEYEGERSIDVDVMIENGIFLWHDLIHARDALNKSFGDNSARFDG